MGGIGPGPYIGKPLLQLRNIALGRRKIIQTALQPLVGKACIRIGERFSKAQHEPRMAFRPGFAEVWQAGQIP